jgi:hypothetical protein
VNVQARREYAANAILEDARLRGELTDEQYEPIQAEALAYVDEVARKSRQAAEIDRAIAEAKERVRARVAAQQAASESPLARLLRRFRR